MQRTDARLAVEREFEQVARTLEARGQEGLEPALAEAYVLVKEEARARAKANERSKHGPHTRLALPPDLVIDILLAADRDAHGEACRCVRVPGASLLDAALRDARDTIGRLDERVHRKTRTKADVLAVVRQLTVRYYALQDPTVDSRQRHQDARGKHATRSIDFEFGAEVCVDSAVGLPHAMLQSRSIDTGALRAWLEFDVKERTERAQLRGARAVMQMSLVMHGDWSACEFGFADGRPAPADANPRTASRAAEARVRVRTAVRHRFALLARHRGRLPPPERAVWFEAIVLAGVPAWECLPVQATDHPRAELLVELLADVARGTAGGTATFVCAIGKCVDESLRCAVLATARNTAAPAVASTDPGVDASAPLTHVRDCEVMLSGVKTERIPCKARDRALWIGNKLPQRLIEMMLRPPMAAAWRHVFDVLLGFRRDRARNGMINPPIDVGPPLDAPVATPATVEQDTVMLARRAARLTLLAAAYEHDIVEPQMERGLHPDDVRVLADMFAARCAAVEVSALAHSRIPGLAHTIVQYAGVADDDIQRIRERAGSLREPLYGARTIR